MSNGDLFSSASGPGVERSVGLGAAVWILAIQFFIAQFVVQLAWTTPFSLTKNYISDLGNTACGPSRTGTWVWESEGWSDWRRTLCLFGYLWRVVTSCVIGNFVNTIAGR